MHAVVGIVGGLRGSWGLSMAEILCFRTKTPIPASCVRSSSVQVGTFSLVKERDRPSCCQIAILMTFHFPYCCRFVGRHLVAGDEVDRGLLLDNYTNDVYSLSLWPVAVALQVGTFSLVKRSTEVLALPFARWVRSLAFLPKEKGVLFRSKAVLAVAGSDRKLVFHAVSDVMERYVCMYVCTYRGRILGRSLRRKNCCCMDGF